MTELEFRSIEMKVETEEAKQRALRYIAHTQRTVGELKNKLRSLGFQGTVIDVVVDFFHRYKYLDDADYVRSYVHDALLRGKNGPRVIRKKLVRKGISPPLIESEAPLLSYDETHIMNATALASKKLNILRKKHGDDLYALTGKIIQYLVARGFTFELAREIVNNILKEDQRK